MGYFFTFIGGIIMGILLVSLCAANSYNNKEN